MTVIEKWLGGYQYLIMGILGLLIAAVITWLVVMRDAREKRRSLLAYWLVWPLLLDVKEGAKEKSNKKFVVLGFLIMFLLVFGAILWHPQVR